MRICLVSNRSGLLDEGMSNVARHLEQRLSPDHQTLHIRVSGTRVLSPSWWGDVRRFQPDLIHYVPGPSLKSLMIVKLLKLANGRARTVMSATRPSLSPVASPVLRWLRPDLILVQSERMETLFGNLGYPVRFLPNGVDVQRFAPVSRRQKVALRARYGVPEGKFVVLHVGPAKKNRNVSALLELQRCSDVQLVLAASITNAAEASTLALLRRNGCIVWRQFLEHIEDVYALSDCYVFPTVDHRAAVETPLSVLEAMACNLPVITTRFGALPRLFEEGDGLRFVDDPSEIAELARPGACDRDGIKTREKVLPYSWEMVTKQLDSIYAEVLEA